MSRWSSIACITVLALGLLTPIQPAKAQPALPNLYMDPLEFIFMGRDAGGNCVGSLKITIHNKSDVKAGRFNNAVKLPTEVKYLEAAGLVAWGIASRSFTVTIPRGTTFNFTAKADVDNEVQESNELDNHRTLPWTCTSS